MYVTFTKISFTKSRSSLRHGVGKLVHSLHATLHMCSGRAQWYVLYVSQRWGQCSPYCDTISDCPSICVVPLPNSITERPK